MNEHRACLGLGSNVEPALQLRRALAALCLIDGITVQAVSNVWQSAAVGLTLDAPDYLNAALLVSTTLTETELTARLKQVESDLGRERGSDGDSDRSVLVAIDLDILVFDGVAVSPDLWELVYRAVPAAELLPDLVSSLTGETLKRAARRLVSSTRIGSRPEILPGQPPVVSLPSLISPAPESLSWPT